MKRKALGLLLSTCIAIYCVQPVFTYADSSPVISVYVNGKGVTFDQPPVIQNNRTLVPISAVVKALGAQVNWDGNTQTVTINKGTTTISFKIGSKIAEVNNSPVMMDSQATVINNRTLIPLRFLSENLGEKVIWNGNTNSVLITEPQNGGSNSTGDNSASQGATSLPPLEQSIMQHMENRETTFTVSLDNADQSNLIQNSIDDVLKQDDYLANDFTGYRTESTYDNSGAGTVTFNVTYLEDQDQINYVDQKVQHILSTIITPDMNDYQKEKAIHDYIVKNVAYDTSQTKYSAYDALTTGETVCQGYALLTYKMLTNVGIPARIITGTAGGESHAWNLVKIDGQWFHLDTTWDDPVPDVKGRVLYNYFNLTDDQIKRDHIWTNDNNYPNANVDFAGVLQTKLTSDPVNTNFYNDLLSDIGENAIVANNFQDLQNALQQATTSGISKVVIKYPSNSENALYGDVNNAIQGLSLSRTANFDYTDNKDTRDDGYYILTFSITYN